MVFLLVSFSNISTRVPFPPKQRKRTPPKRTWKTQRRHSRGFPFGFPLNLPPPPPHKKKGFPYKKQTHSAQDGPASARGQLRGPAGGGGSARLRVTPGMGGVGSGWDECPGFLVGFCRETKRNPTILGGKRWSAVGFFFGFSLFESTFFLRWLQREAKTKATKTSPPPLPILRQTRVETFPGPKNLGTSKYVLSRSPLQRCNDAPRASKAFRMGCWALNW